jgi:hypothetical protein
MQTSKKLISFIRRCWEHVMPQAGKTHDKNIAMKLGNSMAFQASALTSHGWAIRRINWNDDTTMTEMDAAKRFCALARPELINFQKVAQYDSVDVIGRSADGSISENFQIVRPWEGDFWKKLKTSHGVDKEALSKDEFCRLIDKAVNGKLKYPLRDRKTLILLIDASPVRIQAETEVTSHLNTVSDRTGFKEIRLVGLDQVV